jgi:hypothetical protein
MVVSAKAPASYSVLDNGGISTLLTNSQKRKSMDTRFGHYTGQNHLSQDAYSNQESMLGRSLLFID